MAKKRAQADHRADTRGAALSGLPHAVADSPAYLSLSPFERAVLAEILRRFNGYNNGEIGISYEEIGARVKGSNSSLPHNGRIARAIAALHDRGLIDEPTPECWLQRKARTYRLTFITSGKAPPFKSATNEYLRWSPRVKNDGDAGSPETPPSGDARSPEPIHAGDAESPRNLKNGSFACDQSSSSGDAGSLLIVKPYPTPETGGDFPSSLDPQIVDDPRAAALDLRQKILGYWKKLNPKRQRSWAEAHGLTRHDVAHYCNGDPYHLPPAKVAAMVLAIKNEKAEARLRAAGKAAA